MWSLIDMDLLEEEGIAAALNAVGYTDLIPYADSPNVSNPFNDNYIKPGAYRYVCHTLLAEAGVKVYLESPVVGTMMEENIIKGVEIATPFGKRLLAAKRIVDTSQNAVVCTYAGEAFSAPQVYMGSHIKCAGVDVNRMIDYIRNTEEDWRIRPMTERPADPDEIQRMADRGCTLFIHGFETALRKAAEENEKYECLLQDLPIMILYEHNGIASPFVRGSTVDVSNTALYSSEVSFARRKQWLYYTFFRDYIPGCENMILMDTCPHIAKAHLQSGEPSNLTSRYLNVDEIRSGQLNDGEGIVVVRGHPGVCQDQIGWRLPLGTLVAKNFENLLITGKPACRVIHYIATCAAVGQAAGAAAALSASTDTSLREMDEKLIREELSSERQNFAWKV